MILEACPKKRCQHIFFVVRPLFGQEYSRALCHGLPHCLPLAFRSALAVFNEAEVAELGGHHQHCFSRENFPSDKSLNQLPCSKAPTPLPDATPDHSLAEKRSLNMISKGACPTTTWKAEADCKSPV